MKSIKIKSNDKNIVQELDKFYNQILGTEFLLCLGKNLQFFMFFKSIKEFCFGHLMNH